MNSFSLIVSFYTCSDIQIHSFVNISHKNMTFSTLSYYLHALLLQQRLREDCIFLFCCSLLQKKNSFFYHIFALLYFYPSYIYSLMAFFLVGFLSAYEVSKVAKIRNRYNQVPHLTKDTNGKVINSQKTLQTRAKRSALSQQVTTKHI